MSFDIAASLRRLKPHKQTAPLRRRSDSDLLFADQLDPVGSPLQLDTTVYIDALQDRLPDAAVALLRVRQINHSSVAVAELSHLLGRLDPAHRGTAKISAAIARTIASIPAHRLLVPSVTVAAEAGILTGLYARLQGVQRQHRLALLNDAQLFLQALAEGFTLLSRNIADMDYLQQLQPAGRVIFYRQKP